MPTRRSSSIPGPTGRGSRRRGPTSARDGSRTRSSALNQAISLNSRASSYYYVLAGLYRRLGKDGREPEGARIVQAPRARDRTISRRCGAASTAPTRPPRGRKGEPPRRRPRPIPPGLPADAGGLGGGRAPAAPASRVPRRGRARARSLHGRHRGGRPRSRPERLGKGPGQSSSSSRRWAAASPSSTTTTTAGSTSSSSTGRSLDPKVRDGRPTSYLFRNNRDGTFTDVTEKAGLTRSGWGQACCVGDYDNDGFDDLFVTYWGQERPLPQQRRRHVHRRLREGRRRRVRRPLGRRLLLPRLRP